MDRKLNKSGENSTRKELQVINGNTVAGSIPPFAKKPIHTIKDARRMLARLIHAFQLGTIDSMKAKTLCYLLISYSHLVKDHDFEKRITALEVKAKKK